MKSSLTVLAAAAVVLMAAPAYAAGTNLVQNGDFSTLLNGSSDGSQISPSEGTQELANWTISDRSASPGTPGLGFIFTSGEGDSQSASSTGVYLYGPANGNSNGLTASSGATTTGGYSGQNGGNYIALDADSTVSGTLSQSISGLTVGSSYALTFEWATAQLDTQTPTATTESLTVSLGSQTQSTATLSTAAKGFDAWTQATMFFTATSTTETLSFLAVGSPAGDPPTVLLDAVSLTAAPEPSTWGIMLAGMAGLAGFTAIRRRSRGNPATTA
jgi:hypothetical protein